MSLGIITHEELYNANGGALGASANTFYKRKLTNNSLNENGVIAAFRNSSGSPANTFDLNDGTYRIEAWLSFYVSYSFSATAQTATAVAALYNETDTVVEATFTPTYNNNSASSLVNCGVPAATIGVGRQIVLCCKEAFSVAGGPKTFSFQAAISGTTNWANNSTTCGSAHGINTLIGGSSLANMYLFAKIIQKA